MKKLYFFMLCAFTVPAFAQTTVLKNKVAKKADSLQKQIVAWRRDFHEHPELGNREFRTGKIIAEQLKKLGLEVQEGVAKTGVVGILRGGIAFGLDGRGMRQEFVGDLGVFGCPAETDGQFALIGGQRAVA